MSLLHLHLAALLMLGACTSAVPEPRATVASGIGRPASCPRCQSRDFVAIAYGLLAPEGLQSVRDGLVVSGGCMVDRENPDWHCKSCGHEWYDADDPQRKAEWDAFEREVQELYDRLDERQKPPKKPQQPASAPSGDRG